MDPTLPGGNHLEQTLRAVARDDAALVPAAHVEARLREHVRTLRHASRQALRPDSGPRRASTPASWRTWAAAVAAGVLFAVIWRMVPSQPPERLAPEEPAPEFAAEFLPLPYAHVPVARGHVVRMPVPRTALASFGLGPGRAGDDGSVLADVFVGEDGIARSVRFVGLSLQEHAIQEDTVQ